MATEKEIEQIIEEGKNAPPDVPEDFLIKDVEFLHVHDKLIFILENELIVHTPISSYRKLFKASKRDRENFEILGSGSVVQWEKLKLTISAEGVIKEYLTNTVFYEKIEWDKFNHELNKAHRTSDSLIGIFQYSQILSKYNFPHNTPKQDPIQYFSSKYKGRVSEINVKSLKDTIFEDFERLTSTYQSTLQKPEIRDYISEVIREMAEKMKKEDDQEKKSSDKSSKKEG